LSSYYDEMARRVARALERHGQEAAEQVVVEVKKRVRRYLDYCDHYIWRADREEFLKFKEPALRLLAGPNSDPTLGPTWTIQLLHDLGHDLGGRFRLTSRTLRRTSDNPYFPLHWKVTEGKEYAVPEGRRVG
jgi:hypothetical protein